MRREKQAKAETETKRERDIYKNCKYFIVEK